VLDEVLLDVAHHAHRELGGENARVLCLVLLEDVRLHGAADLRERLGPDALVRLAIDELIPGDPQQPEAVAVIGGRLVAAIDGALAAAIELGDLLLRRVPLAGLVQVPLDALVDRRIHEHREDHRCRAVDRHRDGRVRRAQIEP
jgi:hypothetical protein